MIEDFEIGHNTTIDAIVGVPLGGLLVACAVSYNTSTYNCPMLIIRKEPKNHGTNLLIEGEIRSKMNVILLEDVTTTGASALAAIEILKNVNVNVCAVFSVVDRSCGEVKKIIPNFSSVCDLNDLV